MKLTVERTDQQWTSKQAVNSPKETYCTAMYCTAHCVRSSLGHKQTNKQTEKERKRERIEWSAALAKCNLASVKALLAAETVVAGGQWW